MRRRGGWAGGVLTAALVGAGLPVAGVPPGAPAGAGLLGDGLAGPAGPAFFVAPQQSRVAMEVDTTVVHLGDPVSVRLTVAHPPGWAVQWPDSLDATPFEVLSYDVTTPTEARLVLASFELGDLEVPSLRIPLAGPDGAADTLVTDPFSIGVVSVGLDESGDIREIKGPLSIARSWWGVVLWLALAAVAAGGGVYAWRRRRSQPNIAPPGPPPPPPRPHHEVALEALAALESSRLLEQGRVKEYHVRVSEIVRAYVEGQLEVPALEMTTGEVVDGLRRAALGAALCDNFRSFLERCDLVKFAKLRPVGDDSRASLALARDLVKRTSGSGRPARGADAEDGPDAAAEPDQAQPDQAESVAATGTEP